MIKHVPAWRHFVSLFFALRSFALASMLLAPALPARAVTPQHTYYDAAGRLIAMLGASNDSAHDSYDATDLLSPTRLPSSALTVLQFSPVRGVATSPVTITGTDSGSPPITIVKFNGVAAPTPAVVTITQTSVKAPVSATTDTSPAATIASQSARLRCGQSRASRRRGRAKGSFWKQESIQFQFV